ncbi:HEAT repeat domain-containing protein [Gorillibacterium timonense]|uniref:HEAT repeat domain-containing protein n=1 Tax=Gorillibacterium timonense TaxID=1689269 RepID=UPI00071C7F2B|nr:HEAT repeat domain-containing protein [Gorillibacterium timonense]
MEQETKTGLPENFDKLKAAANRTSSWRDRLAAVEELGKHKSPQSLSALTYRMNHDLVYTVQEAAYNCLKEWGEKVEPPTRQKGDLIKGLMKTLVRIKKSLPEGHSYEDFKEKLKKMRLDLYDAYEGDKGAEFDNWLESTWKALRTRNY